MDDDDVERWINAISLEISELVCRREDGITVQKGNPRESSRFFVWFDVQVVEQRLGRVDEELIVFMEFGNFPNKERGFNFTIVHACFVEVMDRNQ